jgi:hypothetical protein
MGVLVRTALLASLMVLCACGSRLSQENFEQIRDGMSQKEVRAILGDPKDASGGSLLGISGDSATWDDGKTQISVQFLNDKVVSKHMSAGAARK